MKRYETDEQYECRTGKTRGKTLWTLPELTEADRKAFAVKPDPNYVPKPGQPARNEYGTGYLQINAAKWEAK